MVPKETQHLQLFSVSKYWKISFRQLMAIGMRDHRTAATVVRGTLLDQHNDIHIITYCV
uniref:RxLR effector candidate protein n=1 Tax=Hyaloperonospora arabidopsidis (strain Emoy2) TaxID=559515 RepID=M4B5Y5_HYAAE